MHSTEPDDVRLMPVAPHAASAGGGVADAPVRQWSWTWAARWPRVAALVLGQIISVLVTGTGVFSEYLAKDSIRLPTTQSTLNYVLLTGYIAHRWYQQGRLRLAVRWWVYALLAIADVEANYLVVKAYQYTSITSIMLIDCFTIPCVMVLSKAVLRASYTWRHVAGAAFCLGGLCVLVLSDAASATHAASDRPRALLGDLLCALGSVCYAVSNVGQEAIVKQFERTEFLGMIGAFGFLFNGIQLLALESHELTSVHWTPWTAFCMFAFVACLFLMYSLTSVFLQHCDAALFNLSLLTSDFWAVVLGLVLFGIRLNMLYFVAFGIIVGGLALYNLQAPAVTASAGKMLASVDGVDAVGSDDDDVERGRVSRGSIAGEGGRGAVAAATDATPIVASRGTSGGSTGSVSGRRSRGSSHGGAAVDGAGSSSSVGGDGGGMRGGEPDRQRLLS